MRLLLVASPVGSLHSGQVGGVGLDIFNIAQEMQLRGHELQVVAPYGSRIESISVKEIEGNFQPLAPNQNSTAPVIIPPNAVLSNMWEYARRVQGNYDLLINFAYDWLPFYLAPFFHRPVLHRVNMGSWTLIMDRAIEQVAFLCPGTLGALTRSQAATFSVAKQFRCLGAGLDINKYEFCAEPGDSLAWVARISPEKGLEDAVAAAEETGVTLKIFGYIQNQDYWQQVRQDYPQAQIKYMGFLPTEQLQKELGKCRGLLMTHHWVEAFGMVAIEALACGVPVITYNRGGPGEIIKDGETGILVEQAQVEGLVKAIQNVDTLERKACRQQVEAEYSLEVFGDRLEQWFQDVPNSAHG
ncbi:MAG: glycosyltransferase family 4 protein [Spirulinaceae cyanobacterium]